MIKRFILSGFIILNISCAKTYRNNYNFKCASQLTNDEIDLYRSNSFKDYKNDDLNLLVNISTFISEINGDTLEFEIFYNKKTDTLLAIDIYGIENLNQIDNITCSIFSDFQTKLPGKLIVLFHRYKNVNKDGGVIVGLTKK